MENHTENSTLFSDEDLEYDHFTDELHNTMFYITSSIAVLLSVISDIVLMYLIIKTKRLKIKPHAVLFNWALWNAIFLLSIGSFFGILYKIVRSFNDTNFLTCILYKVDAYSHTLCSIFLLLYVSNTIMNSIKFSTKLLLCIIYTLFGVLTGIVSITCSFSKFYINTDISSPILILVMVMLILIVIFKDINRCYKLKEGGINSESNFRLNIAKIYVYSWCSAIGFGLFRVLLKIQVLRISSVVFIFVLFNPVIILFYILNVDKIFRTCFFNLIKFNFRENEAETRTNFVEEVDRDVDHTHTVV